MDNSRKTENEIKSLETLLKEHIKGEEITVSEILHEIKEMREQLTPLVELYTNSIGAYRTITWALKFTALIGACVGAIALIKKI